MTHYVSSRLVFLVTRVYGQEEAALRCNDSKGTGRPTYARFTPKRIWYSVKCESQSKLGYLGNTNVQVENMN